ncbi:MAG: HEAT repeat domain-containing protein, partial [Limisphaerales bacterium]
MQWWSLKQLKSASARARLSAVGKLGREGETTIIPALTELLGDGDAAVRAATARALGRIGVNEVISPLFVRLQIDPEIEVRGSIVKALSGVPLAEAIPPLVEALLDPCGEVGWAAAQALKARRWEPADDTERAAMHLANTHFDAAIALGAAAIGPLIKVAQGVTFQRSIRAVEALAAVGGAQAVKPLLDCLRSEDFTVRSATVTALGEVGDGRALEPLIAVLDDSHHQVVLAACISLGKIGDKRAVEAIIGTIQHQAPDVRTAAVETLGKLRDRRAVPVLVECLRDTDNYVREAAAVSLGSICDEESIEHLVVALTDREITVRQAAAAALGRIQPHWEQTEAALRAIPQLQSSIKDKDYWVRNSAADVLRKLGVTRDGESPMITDSDGARKKRLAAHSILFSMLSDRDRIFRQAAAETLGRIGSSESVPHLVERLI